VSLANQSASASLSATNHVLAPASVTNHLSAQYSQFLASVRDFKPLVADLNASIASIANSVTTIGADVGGHVASDSVAGSNHYVTDVTLHSPISHQLPSVMSDENGQRSQRLHDDHINQNHGKV